MPGSAKETADFLRPPVSILSPLRYPGAKRRLAGYIAETLRINGLRPRLFVEPFAGSASVSLQLLQEGSVESIGLGEADPLLASFWKTVFFDSEWLIKKIEEIEITVPEWRLFKHSKPKTDRDRALTCLFLNRTSFSGIIAPHAGPIGGFRQSSEYAIDCRFNRRGLANRVAQAASLSDRVDFVRHLQWPATAKLAVKKFRRKRDVFFYMDRPFFQKAEKLYTFFFDLKDHVQLRDHLTQEDRPWLLSYDASPYVWNMYQQNGHTPRHIDLLYSVSASNDSGRGAARELVISNLPRLPRRTRIWRSQAEWGPGRGPSAWPLSKDGAARLINRKALNGRAPAVAPLHASGPRKT